MTEENVAQPSLHAQTLLRDAVNGHADSREALAGYIQRLEAERTSKLAPDPHCLIIEEGARIAVCGHCGSKYHISLFNDALRRAAEEGFRLGQVTHDQIITRAIEAAYR